MLNTSKLSALIDNLKLTPHPEGGYFKETYRSTGSIPQNALDKEFTGDRSYSTGIYFLLTSDNFSSLHRIKQDEMWHFYDGGPLLVHVITPEGKYYTINLGRDFENGEVPQAVVPAGCWFGATVKNENDYSFVGCTVAPGFDFADFELAKEKELLEIYPQHKNVIEALTRI